MPTIATAGGRKMPLKEEEGAAPATEGSEFRTACLGHDTSLWPNRASALSIDNL